MPAENVGTRRPPAIRICDQHRLTSSRRRNRCPCLKRQFDQRKYGPYHLPKHRRGRYNGRNYFARFTQEASATQHRHRNSVTFSIFLQTVLSIPSARRRPPSSKPYVLNFPATWSRVISAITFLGGRSAISESRRANKSKLLAISPVHPVWWLAPRPAPLSPWKYS